MTPHSFASWWVTSSRNQLPLAYFHLLTLSTSLSDMAFTSDYTGTSIDQHEQQQNHDQSTFQDSYLHPKVNQIKSPAHSHESGTRSTSTQLVSPISATVNETVNTTNKRYPTPGPTKELGLSDYYRYNLHDHKYHNQPSNSFFSTFSSSFQIGVNGNINNNIYPIDHNSTFPFLNGNQFFVSDLNFYNCESSSIDAESVQWGLG